MITNYTHEHYIDHWLLALDRHLFHDIWLHMMGCDLCVVPIDACMVELMMTDAWT